MTFDELRANNPDLGFALYALEPGGPVTFEAYTHTGQVFTWIDKTAEGAIRQAFPPQEDPPAPAAPEPSILD